MLSSNLHIVKTEIMRLYADINIECIQMIADLWYTLNTLNAILGS